MVFVLAILAGLGDVLGGLLPFHPWAQKISLRYMLALAAGVVVAAAFFELLPEAKVESNWFFLGIGFFTYYLIEKGLELHTCDERECTARGASWITVVGMASDNIIDGIGIGIGYAVNPVVGLVITLAVVAHEVPQGMVTTVIMKEAGYKLSRIMPMLIFAGALYPAGVAISGFVPESSMHLAVAFVAGVFIYIGASALLTEAHRRFNARVMATVMVGAVLALGLRFLE